MKRPSLNYKNGEKEILVGFFEELLLDLKKMVLNDLLYEFVDSNYLKQYKDCMDGKSTINYLISYY